MTSRNSRACGKPALPETSSGRNKRDIPDSGRLNCSLIALKEVMRVLLIVKSHVVSSCILAIMVN